MSDITLLHGDCLEVMPTLPANSVQMVFADLPYRMINYHSTDCHWDVVFDLSVFWEASAQCATKECASIFTASQPFTTSLINSNSKFFRYTLVWDKVVAGNFLNAKRIPMRNHEDVVVFYEKNPTFNPVMELREKPRNYTDTRKKASQSTGAYAQHKGFCKTYTHKYPKSIFVAGTRSDPQRGLHPTQKPVALLEWLIKTYTNPGDTVLDPCAGSGTTAIAAMRTGRRAICIEKDAVYFEVMKKRVAEERAKMEAT